MVLGINKIVAENKAINAQKKDSSYQGTTNAYKDAVNKYEVREKNELNK